MTRRVEVKEGQNFRDRTGLAVRVERTGSNNRIHFSLIDYREGTNAGPDEMSDFASLAALQESSNDLPKSCARLRTLVQSVPLRRDSCTLLFPKRQIAESCGTSTEPQCLSLTR